MLKENWNQARLSQERAAPARSDHSKTSVLQSLGSVASKRTYAFAINDLIAWYCSEPRLAFGVSVRRLPCLS
jgi:hypothetical protein